MPQLARWFQQYLPAGAASGAACALLAWLLALTPSGQRLDDWLFDGCFAWRGKRPSQHNVLIVGLDQASLEELHKPQVYISPELAEVVRYASDERAAAIGIDIIIPEYLENLPELQEGGPGDATKLAEALVQARTGVLSQWKIGDSHWLRPIHPWRLKELADPAEGDLAFINLAPDGDKFVRRQQLISVDEQQQHVWSFPLSLFARASGATVEWRDGGLWVDDQEIPLDRNQQLEINYVGPPGSIPSVPFRDVLAAARGQKRLSQSLAGKTLIIASTSGGSHDEHPTPFAHNFASLLPGTAADETQGPEIHASVIATLADRAFIRTLSPPLALLLLVVVGMLLGAAFSVLGMLRGLVLEVLYHFVVKGACFAAFAWFDIRLGILALLLLGGLVFAASILGRWHRLYQMFGTFKSASLVRQLERDRKSLGASGEERVVTVLFADVRDFTSFSETHDARQVVTLLNRYFESIVPIIERNGGMLNQYMGDGVMVLFGAPQRMEDHASRAVRTAVEMVARVHELHSTWADLDCPGFRIGVGVHTGPVVVGIIGSPQRLDYTAIGDTVNVAARIEAQNKDQGTEVLISADSHRALSRTERTSLALGESVTAKLKGKAEALQVYPIAVDGKAEARATIPLTRSGS